MLLANQVDCAANENPDYQIQKAVNHYLIGYYPECGIWLRPEIHHYKCDLAIHLNNLKRVLVLCTGNSCRSQIAEGYLRYFAGDRAEIYSAGIETHGVDLRAIEVMKEDGIDISHHRSNHLDEYLHIDFDFVITVCDNAKESCPFFPASAKKFHHNFPDPAKAAGTKAGVLEQFRQVRQRIKEYSEKFVTEYLPAT